MSPDPGGQTERPATSRARMVVVSFTLALVALAYLDRVCIATAAPSIRKELGFDAEQMGLVFGAFSLAYALFEMPSGWFADRFGPRLALTRIVLWWSAMTAATSLATGLGSLLVLRGLFGIGEAGTFPSTARVYERWLPARERGTAFGLAIATGAIGGALTMQFVVLLLSHVSWRTAFALFGSVGSVWAVLWWRFFRDDPREHVGVSAVELALIEGDRALRPAHGAVPWARIARCAPLWALSSMYVGAIYGWYFFLTWMPTYLLEARGFEKASLGFLSALPLLAIALGVWTGGLASDRLASRRHPRARQLPGLVGFPLAALATAFAALSASAPTAAVVLALAAGLGAFGVAPAWALCLEIGGEHAGVVTGAMNMFGNLGGTLCPILVGVCVKRFGSWPVALGTVSAFYLLSALLFLLVDPTAKLELGTGGARVLQDAAPPGEREGPLGFR